MITLISELLSLMILLVYVGAISVLFIYVSAVSPNTPIYTSNSYLAYVSTMLCRVLVLYVVDVATSFIHSSALSPSTSEEIFTGMGILCTLGVVYILVVVLAGVTFMSPSSSTFRSFS